MYEEWLAWLREELDRPDCDRNELCRQILTDLYYPHLAGADPASLPMTTRVALAHMDPRNVTLEPTYYQELDEAQYAPRKPLLWLWEMFDRSPLGENVHLGIKFRRVLAHKVFKSCGKSFKVTSSSTTGVGSRSATAPPSRTSPTSTPTPTTSWTVESCPLPGPSSRTG
jgi:hypothetical protein